MASLLPGALPVTQASAGSAGRLQEGLNLFAKLGCCRRQVHHLYVGRDLSGSPVRVDVGLCGTGCGVWRKTSSPSPGFSKQASMLDFLRTRKDRLSWSSAGPEPVAGCAPGYGCEPSRVRVEDHVLLEGVRQVEVIEGCQCSATPHACLRSPALKTFFPGSPLERTLDVGKCSRPPHAEDGLFCVPTDFDSVLVKSPNGHQVVRMLRRCALREPCHRVPHVEHYAEVTLNAAGEKMERLKEIDVGRCLGRCDSGSSSLLWDWQTPGNCPAWDEGASGRCAPHQYETHTFRIRTGELRTVFVIRTCKCGA
ncbi:uncharacterized protein LOC134413167 [Elgaria multicarinata webbii]|uniref:uncharacterized protein LOC134413167 n=1 Tax=Elgaria multicarinata webbii TaxID=159646 RepID=UPI002FCCD743